MSFTSIPILDLSLARNPETKPAFLDSLRHALLEVGFLYISNTGISDALINDVITQAKAFFDLPEEKKLEIQMKNVPSFLGYSKLGNETTHSRPDWREQLDLSTPHPIPPPTAPLYHNLLAPNQWPSPSLLPLFRPVYETYIQKMSHLSENFTTLLAEAIGLPPQAFDRFFDPSQQHKLKIVKYPDVSALGLSSDGAGQNPLESQGVGPHKDSILTSYLLQVPPHTGLQALSPAGTWVSCPPVAGTFVVAIGQGLEALTSGVCASTTHRVLSPAAGLGPRYSVPFFQGVSYDARFECVECPGWVREMRGRVVERERERRRRKKKGRGEGGGEEEEEEEEVEFTFLKGRWGRLGEATLVNRVRSHVDVGERWYPELLERVREEQRLKEREGGDAGKVGGKGEPGGVERAVETH